MLAVQRALDEFSCIRRQPTCFLRAKLNEWGPLIPGMVSMLKMPLDALLVGLVPVVGSVGCQEEVRPAAMSLAGTLDNAGCQ